MGIAHRGCGTICCVCVLFGLGSDDHGPDHAINRLYGISTAQTYFYYRTFGTDPLYTRILVSYDLMMFLKIQLTAALDRSCMAAEHHSLGHGDTYSLVLSHRRCWW